MNDRRRKRRRSGNEDIHSFLKNIDEEINKTKSRLLQGFINAQREYDVDIQCVSKNLSGNHNMGTFMYDIDETLNNTKRLLMGRILKEDGNRSNAAISQKHKEKESLLQVLQRTGDEFWATVDELKVNNKIEKRNDKNVAIRNVQTPATEDDGVNVKDVYLHDNHKRQTTVQYKGEFQM